ncbi:MAG: hypothetical protein JWO63_328 [Frankiales bacterium]|nr:hypothetical protein [Frankiales bacterium]
MASSSARVMTGAALAATGIAHIERRLAFHSLIPHWLTPLQRDIQVATGALEIVGGVAMFIPPLQRFSRVFNLSLRAASVLVAVEAVRHPERTRRWPAPVPDLRPVVAVLRVPWQIGAALLIWWTTRRP